MRLISLRHIVVGLAMVVASGMAVALKPTKLAAHDGPKVSLEVMIPKQFGDWIVDTSLAPVQVSPDIQARLNKVYEQTLSRTYINQSGHRIMLSIAYGGSHGEGMQTHRPEICYPAQGFNIDRILGAFSLHTAYGDLPTTRLVASMGSRVEPISYWVVVGDRRTGFGTQMKLAQLRYNLTGVIPDGMLVRVSSIDRDDKRAYELQERFIGELLASMNGSDRVRLTGKS